MSLVQTIQATVTATGLEDVSVYEMDGGVYLGFWRSGSHRIAVNSSAEAEEILNELVAWRETMRRPQPRPTCYRPVWVECSSAVAKAAATAGVETRTCGGGVTPLLIEFDLNRKAEVEAVLGRPIVNVPYSTFDDIPDRGRKRWSFYR